MTFRFPPNVVFENWSNFRMICWTTTTTFYQAKIAGRESSTEMQIECSKVTTDLISLAIGDAGVMPTTSVVSILIGKSYV